MGFFRAAFLTRNHRGFGFVSFSVCIPSLSPCLWCKLRERGLTFPTALSGPWASAWHIAALQHRNADGRRACMVYTTAWLCHSDPVSCWRLLLTASQDFTQVNPVEVTMPRKPIQDSGDIPRLGVESLPSFNNLYEIEYFTYAKLWKPITE